MLWMPSTGRVSKREEKALSLSMLFVLIPLYKPCEKSLLYPLVKKLPTGLHGNTCVLLLLSCTPKMHPPSQDGLSGRLVPIIQTFFQHEESADLGV